MTPDLSGIGRPERWRDLKAIGLAEAERHIGTHVSLEQRVFIGSFDRGAEVFGRAVRDHWGFENSLHWVLDMTFREDESRICRGDATQNFAVLRRMALNLLKRRVGRSLSRQGIVYITRFDAFALVAAVLQ